MDKRLTTERNNLDFGPDKHASMNSLDSDSKSSSLNSKHANESMVRHPKFLEFFFFKNLFVVFSKLFLFSTITTTVCKKI